MKTNLEWVVSMVTRDSKQEAMIFTGWGIRSDISKKCKYQITNTNKKVYKYKTLGSRRQMEEALLWMGTPVTGKLEIHRLLWIDNIFIIIKLINIIIIILVVLSF